MENIILPKIVAIGLYNANHAVKNRTVTKNRKTTMFEIELPIENGGISYIDDESHRITDGMVICAKPGEMRHTRLPFKCYYAHIIINEGGLFDLLSSLPNYIEIDDTGEIRKIFTSLCKHHDINDPDDEFILQSLILKLAYTLKKSAPMLKHAGKSKKNNREAIEKIIAHINKNLTADLSLKALATEAKFSPIYFHKLFKASTGKTLREYVEAERIKKAVELLLSTDMTLTQISYECGFSSQSYFSYAFKKRMGTSPREYAIRLFGEYGISK